MSEITRYDVDGRDWELLEAGDGDYVRHADHLIYLREMRMDRDVERLRADTAEAELAELRKFNDSLMARNLEIQADSYRLANLQGLLAQCKPALRGGGNQKLIDVIDAALNQKSEGESQ